MSEKLRLSALPVIAFLVASHAPVQAAPQAAVTNAITGGCDLQTLAKSKAEFLRLSTLHDSDPNAVTDEELRQTSTEYVVTAESCYRALYSGSSTTQVIDDGGVWFAPDGSQSFVTRGNKWGAGSPFAGGTNIPGPRLPGGTVTYSFMADGISASAEGSDTTSAISSLPTYSACFLTEISNAFAAWSAVANIQFVQVADGGLAFNASGATGDIRIAAHTFDGPSGTLAHGYYPPPNGASAAGDVHFDRHENWSCTPGAGIDIGIVATHEFGHAIGLGHETMNTAVMNPFYNSSVTLPLADDINGASAIYGSPFVPAGSAVGDFDGDGKADVTVYRPGNGTWFILKSNTNFTSAVSHQWGFSTDKPVPGDYDGDGIADIAIYRPGSGTWYILKSSASFAAAVSYTWGLGADIPVPGDYDGDGITDVAIYRPGSGVWYILKSSANFAAAVSHTWGLGADIPVPGDYDGDGAADIAVYRPSSGAWYILKSSANFTAAISYTWGVGADIPVAADYDGDGRADVAVYRPGSGVWYVLRSSTNFTTAATYTWGGSSGDIPTPADFDGDGKIDVAVYRPGTGVWHILRSTTDFTVDSSYAWGAATDIPIHKRP